MRQIGCGPSLSTVREGDVILDGSKTDSLYGDVLAVCSTHAILDGSKTFGMSLSLLHLCSTHSILDGSKTSKP